LLLILLTWEVAATRIFYRPLAAVLTAETGVLHARLAHVRVEQPSGSYQVFCTLDQVQILRGQPPAQEVLYSFSTNLERNGVRVSPMRDGSGIETSLAEGQTYYFLLDPSGQFAVRIEPESSGEQIKQLLNR
jgi:hypothetical protein